MVMYVVTDLLGMVQVHSTSLIQIQSLGGDDGEANVDTVEEEDRLQRHLPASTCHSSHSELCFGQPAQYSAATDRELHRACR